MPRKWDEYTTGYSIKHIKGSSKPLKNTYMWPGGGAGPKCLWLEHNESCNPSQPAAR